jgi:rubrerythrin
MTSLSRARLIGASSAVALVGPTLFGRFLSLAEAADESDVKILNVAIALERAGIKAYADAARTGLLEKPVLAVATGFMKDHTAHRDALIAAVQQAGGTPTTETAKLTYPELKSQADILKFALSVERQAAATYLSVLSSFKNRALAKTAGAILGVETTHVAVLSQVLGLGTEPYSGGFVTG